MNFVSSLGTAAALAACLATAPAADAQPSAAGGPARWHLDGATSRCVLTRRLEGTPSAATFILRTVPGSGRYDVILAGEGLPADLRRNAREASIVALPGSASYRGRTRAVELPHDLGSGVVLGPLPATFAADFGRSAAIRLVGVGEAELGRWTVPVAGRAAEALAACEAEKQVDWGADPAAVEAGATPARALGDPADWISRRELGLTNPTGSIAFAAVFRLVVGSDGRARSCELVESAGNLDLQDACRALVHRARYEAARDARGNPVRSIAIHVASFELESEFRMIG
jgi:hypothetical protein